MNKAFLATSIVSFFLGCFFINSDKTMALDFPSVNQTQQATTQKTNNLASSESSSSSVKNIVSIPESEGKVVLGKFFVTMLWVVGSCSVLFLILLLYRKKFGKFNMSEVRPVSKEQDLTSPATVDEAVKLFIEKF